MKFRFIEDHRDTWPVRLMCDALEVLASGYYAWRNGGSPPPETHTNRRFWCEGSNTLSLYSNKILD
jgi:hypothetical protein